jgi:hypothetical protein
MDAQAFARFPELPLEIRNMIWGLAISPRLVYIQQGTTYEDVSIQQLLNSRPFRRRGGKTYLYSTSPVPPMLQACSESRQAMKIHGYSLMFGTAKVGPRIWFNGLHDILYMDGLSSYMNRSGRFPGVCNFYYRKATNASDTSVLAQASLADLAQVKRIALLLRNSEQIILEPFHCLAEILLVQEHCLATEYFTLSDKRDRQGDPWVCLDCDVSDALGHCLPHGAEVAYEFHPQIVDRKRSDFFENLGERAEDRLRDYQKRVSDDFDELHSTRPAYITHDGLKIHQNLSIPKIRYAVVKTRTQARQLSKKRTKYWQNVEDEEAWERKIGDDALRMAEEEAGSVETDYNRERHLLEQRAKYWQEVEEEEAWEREVGEDAIRLSEEAADSLDTDYHREEYRYIPC